MINYGFYLNKLKVIGEEVKPASISFEKGLNVISGISNTGKSYIFECINYAFGSEDPPKEIEESLGYTDLLLEIKTYNDKIITLKRNLENGTTYKIDGKMEKWHEYKKKRLTQRHSAGNENTISHLFLSISKLANNYIRKNKNNKKRTLSFRDVAKLILINEQRIITKESPALSGMPVTETAEKSVFNLLLTAEDDEDLIEYENPKIRKAKLKAKIEMIDDLIFDSNEKLKEFEIDNINKTKEKVNRDIDFLVKKLNKLSSLIKENMKERKIIWEKIEEKKSRFLVVEELIKRFELLKEHYSTDLNRLDFVIEGEHYLSQLNTVPCPVCNTNISKSKLEYFCNGKEEPIKLEKAINKEFNKIKMKMLDLKSTLEEITIEKKELIKEIDKLEEKFNELDNHIRNKLKPVSMAKKNELDKLIKKKNKITEFTSNKQQIEDLNEKKSILQKMIKQKKDKSENEEVLDYEIYKELCKEVESILSNWNYPELTNVEFDNDNFDIEVSGQERSSQGKGYRAILFSAFIIGLMKYCIKNNLPHPRLIIIDSPLTTYRGEKNKNEDGEVSENMQQYFFEDLASIKNDKQIIIFENKEPSEEIIEKINYIYFTGNSKAGRKGFFPE